VSFAVEEVHWMKPLVMQGVRVQTAALKGPFLLTGVMYKYDCHNDDEK
jgi:hypothetical protein